MKEATLALYEKVISGKLRDRNMLREIAEKLCRLGFRDRAAIVQYHLDEIEEKRWRQITHRPDFSISRLKIDFALGRRSGESYDFNLNGHNYVTSFQKKSDKVFLNVIDTKNNTHNISSSEMSYQDFMKTKFVDVEAECFRLLCNHEKLGLIEEARLRALDNRYLRLTRDGAPDRNLDGIDDRFQDYDFAGLCFWEDDNDSSSRFQKEKDAR